MREFVYNPLNSKIPSGANKKGEKITYNLKVSKFLGFEKAYFVIHKDGEEDKFFEMQTELVDERYVNLKYSHSFSSIGHFWYHFEVQTEAGYFKLGKSKTFDCEISDSNYLQLIFSKDSEAYKTLGQGIIYHIFVDRFNKKGSVKEREGLHLVDWSKEVEKEYDENGERCNLNCYGGNFSGIIEKLDYLSSLNVSTIYLSPFFEANSSHKYDVANYLKVESMFGGEKKVRELIDKAKERNIKIIIDGVFNHTGSDSVYFNKKGRYSNLGAYQSKKSPYFSWYDFYNYPEEYSCWWGIKTLPQTREGSSFFDFIAGEKGVIEKYMSMGIAGFRLDVVDELSNKFLNAICQRAKKINSKAFMVGEVWEDASLKISYNERKNYFLGGNLDSVTNYPMKKAILNFVKYGNVETFVEVASMILEQYPKQVQNNLMTILDTHDTMRALTYLGIKELKNVNTNEKYQLSDDELKAGVELLKIASLIQYTVMGIPTVFYGDEVGIEGTKDPYCRKPYLWGKENKELLEWYRNLGKLRRNEVFNGGSFEILYAKDGVLAYKRERKGKEVIVMVNRSNEEFECSLDKPMIDYFTKSKVGDYIKIEPNKFLVLVN